MNSGLFAASLLATVLAATAAAAGPVVYADTAFSSPEEAMRHAPPPVGECLDAGGTNTCIPLFQAEIQGLRWRFVWATADTEVLCVDRGSGEFRVDCDAPDAVRSPPPLTICVHSADGRSGGCGPVREYVYRPTPTP